MEKFLTEHKKISFFLISAVIFYFFVAVPFEKLNGNIKNLESKKKRFEGIVFSEKIISDNLKKLEEEKENIEKEYLKNRETQKSYNSLGEFQRELDILLKKNNLKTLEIGRTFSDKNIHRILYTAEGKEKDIISFLLETDKLKEVYFLKTPLEITKEKENIKLKFGAELKIEKNYKKLEKLEKDIKRKNFMGDNRENFELVKFNFVGEKSGIFYIKTGEKTKRYYLKDSEKTIFENELCEINISKERIIIKNMKDGGKIIFYLGDRSGESVKKD